jgi:hypothetical protein
VVESNHPAGYIPFRHHGQEESNLTPRSAGTPESNRLTASLRPVSFILTYVGRRWLEHLNDSLLSRVQALDPPCSTSEPVPARNVLRCVRPVIFYLVVRQVGGIRTRVLRVPNAALYQAQLRPVNVGNHATVYNPSTVVGRLTGV